MSLNPKAAGYQQRASDPRASAWVNANAGSGKTHVLVDRVIRLLLTGAPPSRLLCLTFTKAAAAEMALRISERLSAWLWLDDTELAQALGTIGVKSPEPDTLRRARQLFATVQETPGGLKIQTIHAFCERLLQLFPIEAGVVPHFTVMDDRTAAAQLTAARDETLMAATLNPDSVLGQSLGRLSQRVHADQLDDLLMGVLTQQGPARQLLNDAEGLAAELDRVRAALDVTPGDSPEAVRHDHAIDGATYQRIVDVLAGSGTNDIKLADKLRKLLAIPDCCLIDLAPALLTAKNEPLKLDKVPAKDVHAAHPWVRPFIAKQQDTLIAALKRLGALEQLQATTDLFTFAYHARSGYERRKRALGHYDFDDLIARSSALLDNKPDAAWVLYKLDGGIDHILVDEAQDTSPEQWSVVKALTGEFFSGAGRPSAQRSLFAVGDRKQSIFSFQGADPAVFNSTRSHFEERITAAGQVFSDVNFTVSFRSVPEILQAVDAVFAEGRAARIGLDSADAAAVQHDSNRVKEHGLVEMWDLETPDEKVTHEPWVAPVDRPPGNAPSRKLARRIAVTVKSWIGRRRIAGTGKLVAPSDILILVRRRNMFFAQMISALRLAGVPVAGADRLELSANIAVQDLLALGSAVTQTRDDYNLACVLKSPLLAQPFNEEDLFQLTHPRGSASLWQVLENDSQPRSAEARTLLAPLISAAVTARPFEFFAGVLQQTRARFRARLGSEADDALNAFLQTALDYEADHAPSLAGFLSWFQAGETNIKRDMEQAADEVRIMTVHGAKGLEAPIVILPDTVRSGRGRRTEALIKLADGPEAPALPLWCIPVMVECDRVAHAKQSAITAAEGEYRRLLYVALTRARDELYVCGYEGETARDGDSWYDLVDEGLRLSSATPLREVAAGIRRFGVDPVWNDDPAVPKSDTFDVPAWIGTAVVPSPLLAAAMPVTTLAAGADAPHGQRGAGPSRGLVMHRMLQVLPDAPAAARPRLAVQMAARAGHPKSLAQEALALLEKPDLAWLFQPGALSEVVLAGRIERLDVDVSGRIDRLIVAGQNIIIADFKTDRVWPSSADATPSAYVRQMALYRQLMLDAYPGCTVRCLLVWTSAPLIMDLGEEQLNAALRDLQGARP